MKAEKASLLTRVSAASRVFDEPSSLRIYSFDQGEVPESLKRILLPETRPDLVVQPGSSDDLVSIVRYGLEKGVPLVPRGASTFGMGGAVPHQGGILLDFSAARVVHSLDAEHGLLRVSAGCRWSDAAAWLNPRGLDLCSYPTSWFSTIGGWAATGGVGIGCTRFGSFHDLIHSMTVVTAGGERKEVFSSDPEFRHFLGTEGQMGAIWDVTFRIRRKSAAQFPFVLVFDSPEGAMGCARELLSSLQPYHLKFLSADRAHEINHLMHEEHPGLKSGIGLPEKDLLLVCFESQEEVDAFYRWAQQRSLFVLSDYRAHYLWRERMFPLRVKRIAPGLLASELILPIEEVAAYIREASRLGRRFGVHLAVECYFLNDGTALTLPVYGFRRRNAVDEALKSSLAYVLTQAGIRRGGRPYGIGIWNSPFVKRKFGPRFADLKYYKYSTDPQGRFNPGKFFEAKFPCSWTAKLAAFPLKPWLIPVWTSLAPLAAGILTAPATGARPDDPLLLNEELCSKCGSCIPVCPAYIDTKDERTTARGKLQLGKLILQGGSLTSEEAGTLFLCMHCSACTDVCQSRLDLVPVWDELEKRVEQAYGKDVSRVAAFVKSVEQKKIMEVPYARGAEGLANSQSE